MSTLKTKSRSYISDIGFTPAVKKRQEQMGSRHIYQKMAERRDWQSKISEQLKLFLAGMDSFYMATANAEGQPYIQHRGGPKGFLKVLDDNHLVFGDFSGNRQYISVGNSDENNKVHLFLMDYPNKVRIKIWGEASIVENDPELFELVRDKEYDARIERVVKIRVSAWDINCPQHIQERFTQNEIESYTQQLRSKIEDLEKRLKESELKNNQRQGSD